MYIIKKETRDERDDIFGFYVIEKGLNESKTEIIEVERQVKETTKDQLERELSEIPAQREQLQQQIDELVNKQADLNAMILLINNYSE